MLTKASVWTHPFKSISHSLLDPSRGSVFRRHGNLFFFPSFFSEVPCILVSNILYNKALNREGALVFLHAYYMEFSYASTHAHTHTHTHTHTHIPSKGMSSAATKTWWIPVNHSNNLIILKITADDWRANRRSDDVFRFARSTCF